MGAGTKTQQADLKRMLLRLSLLGGRPWRTAEGLRLVHVTRVRDAAGLIDAGASPSTETLTRCLELTRPPVEITERWLGAAQRDLKILRTTPPLLEAIAESPRTFRRYGTIDRAWLASTQAALDALSDALHSRPASHRARFGLVEALRGADVAARLDGWFDRSLRVGQRVRAEARERLDALLGALRGKPAQADVPDEVIARTVADLRGADRRPGRAFSRVVRRAVQEFMSWPAAVHTRDDEASVLPRDLTAAVTAVAAHFLTALPSTRTPRAMARLERALTMLGLTCAVDDEGALTPADVSLVLRDFGAKKDSSLPPGVPLSRVVAVLRLGLDEQLRGCALTALAAGVSPQTIHALASAKQLERVREFDDDLAALSLWARWTEQLSTPLASRGVTVDLPPRMFSTADRTGDVRAFAEVLLAKDTAGATPEVLLEALDTMLALSRRAPRALHGIRAQLSQSTASLGREAAPAFARWLDDDAALDRHFTLKRLLGEPLTLSRTLRRDFEAQEKLHEERDHLRAKKEPSPAQRTRLSRLEQRLASAETGSPGWTRRQLEQRTAALEARALEVLLDRALRETLSRGWGLELGTRTPTLTPAWRDALRFLLTTKHNAALLTRLLQHAATRPGQPILEALPPNTAWLSRARKHLDVDAWLRHREVPLKLGDRSYVLSTEEDPLEALRMGIPFGTCLSLTDGSNAGAAVLNAIEANKRVLYLRDARGAIVGRKLIAVSKDWRLLGYRTYSALDRGVTAEVDRAFTGLCQAIATEAKLPLGNTGAPENLHGGFWYDDGLVGFDGSPDGVSAAYCASLGRPARRAPGLEEEARAVAARSSKDVDAGLEALSRWRFEGEHRALARWLISRLGEAAALKRAPELPTLGDALLEQAAERGPQHLLAMFGKLGDRPWRNWSRTAELLERAPLPGLARLLTDAARAQCGKAEHFDDHDIEHGTIWLLPTLLEVEPIAQTFVVLERIDPVWRWVVAQQDDCVHCVEGALERLVPIALDQYARAPDPAAVIEALGSNDPNVTRVALAITARFPFPRGRTEQAPSVRGVTMFEGAPVGCPAALRALRELAGRNPHLAGDPRLLAAMIRQTGASTGAVTLPPPTSPPHEALGDLQLHAPALVHELLMAQPPPRDPPGPWALAFHRRHETPWRRALRSAKSSDLGAACWRALLGEVEPAASRRDRVKVETGPKPPPIGSADLPGLSVAVRDQLEGRAPDFRRSVSEVADPVFIASQVRALRVALEGGDDPRAIALCESLDGAPLPTWRDWRAMTEQVLARGASEAVVTSFARRWIPSCTWGAPELPFPLAARLAGHASTRALVVELLARVEPDRALVVFSQLSALRETPALEALLDEWLRAWMASDVDRLGDGRLFSDPRLAARLERLAFESPTVAVQLYLRRPEFHAASTMIAELIRRFDAATLRGALEGGDPNDDDLSCRKAWLLAALG